MVGQLSSYKDGRFRLAEDQICSYYVNSEMSFNAEPVGKVVRCYARRHQRRAAPAGLTEEEIACAWRCAKDLNLRMKIIDAEHIFGGERIVVYFMAEGRVDFRELVRKLAASSRPGSRCARSARGTRPSCWPITRTAARSAAATTSCRLLKPVSMRMAKLQKATLDPSKISGRCGRLKCCLRYEDEATRT